MQRDRGPRRVGHPQCPSWREPADAGGMKRTCHCPLRPPRCQPPGGDRHDG
uniref:Uncharacterized protein n=1 Tax=Nonomuraea gerenzanensis TaxID=93944 RepID=A0A1M4E4U9_9ACTN|nr:hypothetical protein BN4615_P3327 [Nonomuraea gerenzanensis]